MMREWTVKEFAAREQVDPRTVRRWIFKGAIHIRRTVSGRIRIAEPAAKSMTIADNRGQSNT